MADRFWHQITIGGTYKGPIEDLENALGDYEFDIEVLEQKAEDQGDPAGIDDRGHLILTLPESSVGFENLAAFCQEQDLTFLWHRDPLYEYSGENTWWAPGMEAARCAESNSDGHSLMDLSKLQNVIEFLDMSREEWPLHINEKNKEHHNGDLAKLFLQADTTDRFELLKLWLGTCHSKPLSVTDIPPFEIDQGPK